MPAKEQSLTSPTVGAQSKIKAKLLAALLTGVTVLMASPMWATTVMFTLSDCGQAGLAAGCTDSGKKELTYTSGTQTLEATGNANLYLKRSAPSTGETGLGITVDANHEINSGDL